MSFLFQQSRWNLVCVLCNDRAGSCIQCSVRTCRVAYHVTCAFKRGLEMKVLIADENADDVKLRVSFIFISILQLNIHVLIKSGFLTGFM